MSGAVETAEGLRRFRPYDEYKDSGVEWLGDIPVHWEVKQNRSLFRDVDRRSSTGEEELLTVSHLTGVTRRSEKNVTMIEAESHEGYKICEEGELVINTLWGWMGALGVAWERGIVSPAYNIYQLNEAKLHPRFVEYYCRTPANVCDIARHSKGVWRSRLRIYPDDFREVLTLVPPLSEQESIADHLDRELSGMDALVTKKERLIKLLQEKRTALIHEALQLEDTRSLRFGAVADRVCRPINRLDEGVYQPVGLFNRGRGIFHKEPTRGAELGDSTFFWIEEGDLIFSGQFAWEGAIALAGQEDAGCVATHRYPIFRARTEQVETAYLLAFFKTQTGQFLLSEHSRGAAGRNRPLNAGTLLKEKIPVPPLREQQRIAALVHLEKRLSGAIARLSECLEEYRQALISAAVTGRIDVREEVA